MGSHSDSAPRGARAPKNAQLPPKLFSPQPGRAVPPLHSEPHSWSWGPRPPAQLENLPPGSFQPSDLNSPLPPAGPSLPQVYRAGQLHPQEQPLKQGPPQIPPGQLPLTHPGRAPQPPTPTSCRDPGASSPLTLPINPPQLSSEQGQCPSWPLQGQSTQGTRQVQEEGGARPAPEPHSQRAWPRPRDSGEPGGEAQASGMQRLLWGSPDAGATWSMPSTRLEKLQRVLSILSQRLEPDNRKHRPPSSYWDTQALGEPWPETKKLPQVAIHVGALTLLHRRGPGLQELSLPPKYLHRSWDGEEPPLPAP